MNFIKSIFSWINIMALVCLIESILIITGKYTPIHVKGKLEGTELKKWRNTRFIAYIILTIGWYSFTFSKKLPIDNLLELVINLVGIVLLCIGEIISIRNNITKIKKWSSTI